MLAFQISSDERKVNNQPVKWRLMNVIPSSSTRLGAVNTSCVGWQLRCYFLICSFKATLLKSYIWWRNKKHRIPIGFVYFSINTIQFNHPTQTVRNNITPLRQMGHLSPKTAPCPVWGCEWGGGEVLAFHPSASEQRGNEYGCSPSRSCISILRSFYFIPLVRCGERIRSWELHDRQFVRYRLCVPFP